MRRVACQHRWCWKLGLGAPMIDNKNGTCDVAVPHHRKLTQDTTGGNLCKRGEPCP